MLPGCAGVLPSAGRAPISGRCSRAEPRPCPRPQLPSLPTSKRCWSINHDGGASGSPGQAPRLCIHVGNYRSLILMLRGPAFKGWGGVFKITASDKHPE